jgi:hypothetical protein
VVDVEAPKAGAVDVLVDADVEACAAGAPKENLGAAAAAGVVVLVLAGADVEEVAAAAGFPKLKPPVAGAAVAAGVDVPSVIPSYQSLHAFFSCERRAYPTQAQA